MFKFNWLYLTPILVLLAVSNSLAKPESERSDRHNQNPRETQQNNQNSLNNAPANQNRENKQPKQNTSKINIILQSLFQQLVKEESPLGSRSQLCAITPGLLGKTDKIWSDRPLFLWRGSAKEVFLRNYETGELLWHQKVSGDRQSLFYSGVALQPGQVYEWGIRGESTSEARFTFSLIADGERESLDREIQNLQARKQTDKEYALIAAVELAQYFVQKGLWSDALAKLYSVDNPPSQLLQIRKEISNYLCGNS